ncbi:arsenite resistance protein Ars2, putative [Talaromyces stipitatus ATCC 10500]|uniref:Arsenite resistance protein Ars2, putative n=1 Tax=Talaromyces stipitatus (strain ATCC 10500 / CBS 375.48 / QM 6759 / NRRL 1006) TaxID=441959 RepID=B8MRX5_TALSN|nr:arsenite resistance protein Ars2, putative [Talaromyces stipitatus ATCC 10500]EED13308.1 arsenite resistance protein Ars2, putative [Talaromyces stipitatus ATCC 10500]
MDPYDGPTSPGRGRGGDGYRRRSPGISQDRRRSGAGRGRSRSPPGIDRYEPQDRSRGNRADEYYTPTRDNRDYAPRDRDDRRRAASPAAIDRYIPGQDAGKRIVPTNPLPNPMSLDIQVGFTWFAEWWRAEQNIKEEKERAKHGGRHPLNRLKGEKEAREDRDKEKSLIQAAYDSYKADLQIKMSRTFVKQHRNEEWFKEKYVAEVRDPLRRQMMEFRRGVYDQWERDIDSGYFDEFTLEGIYKSESDGAGGVIEKEEGEATAVGETLGVLDLLPARGAELRDEALSQPVLLIKTLAPNVNRIKIEEFCKEHLGEQDGGFRWLSLSDPNPSKKFHRMGWIILHPAAHEPALVERGDGRDEEGEEKEPEATTNGSKTASAAEKALEAVNDKTIYDPVNGDFVCHVGVHVPPSQPRKKALWDLFSAPERIERDLELARRLIGKLDTEMGDVDACTKIEGKVEDLHQRGFLQPTVSSGASKKKNGLDTEMDDGEAEEGEEMEGLDEEDIDDEDLLVKKKKIDLMVEYLRRVHNFCFFCVFESDSVHELVRKCPGGHLRRPRSGLSNQAKQVARASAMGQPFPTKKKDASEEGEETPAAEEKRPQKLSKGEQQLQRAFNWVKTFEDKLLQILEPENVDLTKLGGKDVEQALEEELSKYVKQEDESKFRCKVPECSKLFKADHFWRKHVEKRHEEWYQNIKNDLLLVNEYVLDPAHIAPSRTDANSNGHFPFSSNHIQPGTPRGFNLAANMPYFNGSNVPNTFQGMHAVPGFMGVNAPGFNGMMTGDGTMMSHHGQPGVMRRGGGRYSNRSGPYDRRGGNRNNNHGRLSPVRGMPGMFGRLPGGGGSISGIPYVPPGHPAAAMLPAGGIPAGAGATGAGGTLDGHQAMGPREAVQGRSLKSYEDLDAVGGSGSGELNY